MPITAPPPVQKMFEPSREIKLSNGTISPFPNNLSVYNHESKGITYACVGTKSIINIITWDSKMENITLDHLNVKDVNTDRPVLVMQCKLVMPSARSVPLLVVCTNSGAMVFDSRTHKLLSWNPLDIAISEVLLNNELYLFTRGITWVDNTILVGSFTGEILVFNVSGETSVTVRKPLGEHKEAICDLATCRFDELTCSADMGGTVVVWGKNAKSVQKKISTEQNICCVNVLRKQIIMGTVRGKLLFYSTVSGALMAEVNSHIRPITSIAVAPESAYIMSSSEDCRLNVYKLHTRKPEAYQVEFRHGDEVPNEMIVGAQFINGRGSGLLVAGYDQGHLQLFKIAKKPTKSEDS